MCATQMTLNRLKQPKNFYSVLSLLCTSAHCTYVQFRTLQWIRQDAPIIIHVNLNHVLQFLVKDTHYRNLFEIHTRSGGPNLSDRESWEVTFKLGY